MDIVILFTIFGSDPYVLAETLKIVQKYTIIIIIIVYF